MARYALGLDYGTLSVRAVLLDAATGAQAAQCVYPYRGLGTAALRQQAGAALQDPRDYWDGLVYTVRGVMAQSGARPEEIVGIGLDVTAATVLPVYRDQTPLCLTDRFREEPHAWVKLWKHHTAEAEARWIDQVARQRGEPWLKQYGGRVSAEWAVPKVLETLRKAPQVYREADYFLEMMDWLVWRMTDRLCASASVAGYKAFYLPGQGYPSPDFFRALDPRMEDYPQKLPQVLKPVGSCAGQLTAAAASTLGLRAGTPVAVPLIDAHSAVAGGGISEAGEMVIVMGTSSCHLLLSSRMAAVEGMQAAVKDGFLPGYYGIEAGQSGVGDIFDWFASRCVPREYALEAEARGISVHQLLCEKLRGYRAGDSGLLALDWLSGVRSPLMDFDLTGLLLGLTLHTRPEEIYLALVEATAYGTRLILDQFAKAGVTVSRVVLGGGIPAKNPFIVQVYADVLNRPLWLSASAQASAAGAAILGLCAAGPRESGYGDVMQAVRALAHRRQEAFVPNPAQAARYNLLYAEYRTLADYFGRDGNGVMHRLKSLREPGELPAGG